MRMNSELHSVFSTFCAAMNSSGINMHNKCKLTFYALLFVVLFPAVFLLFAAFFMLYALCGFFCMYFVGVCEVWRKSPLCSVVLLILSPALIPLGLCLIAAFGLLTIGLTFLPCYLFCIYAFLRMQWHWRTSTANERQYNPEDEHKYANTSSEAIPLPAANQEVENHNIEMSTLT